MNTARANIREALAIAALPAVMCSFGKDSLLLLALAREINPDIPVLWFKTGASEELTKFAREIIRAWKLNVYSYQPADVYLLQEGKQVTMVQEFSFGEGYLPLGIDVSEGQKCSLTAFPNRTPQMFLPFDLLLVGYKDTDTHWLKGGVELFGEHFKLGRTRIKAPIRHMTDDQVRAALYEIQVPWREVEDKLTMCTACMTQTGDEVWCPLREQYIPVEQWERELALYGFRKRFQLTQGED